MESSKRKFPVTLMFDSYRHDRLQAISQSTRVSMSELVRLSVDRLMQELGDPERPDLNVLATLLTNGSDTAGQS